MFSLFLFSQGGAFVPLNIAKKRGVDGERFFLIFNTNVFCCLLSFSFILISLWDVTLHSLPCIN